MRTAQIEGWSRYIIYEDGRVYSRSLGRFLKPSATFPYGYYQIFLTADDGFRFPWKLHRLVLIAFVGPPPKYKECHHKDHDKANNHLSNLEWVTHSKNMLEAYNMGRVEYFERRERNKRSRTTLQMRVSSNVKPVLACRGDEELEFHSVADCLEHIGTYRRRFNRAISDGILLDGWDVSFKEVEKPECVDQKDWDYLCGEYNKVYYDRNN